MINTPPQDLGEILSRLSETEKEIAHLKAENTHLKAELARKNKIIAGLQQRLFGFSSEKLDPAQLQLLFDEIVLGKPLPPPESSGETSALEEVKSSAPKVRRAKAELFPKNLKILIGDTIIPESVLANSDDWEEIGEEYHDELDVTKAEIFWRRTIRRKFKNIANKALPPVIAPAPLPSIPGTLLAPAFAAVAVAL